MSKEKLSELQQYLSKYSIILLEKELKYEQQSIPSIDTAYSLARGFVDRWNARRTYTEYYSSNQNVFISSYAKILTNVQTLGVVDPNNQYKVVDSLNPYATSRNQGDDENTYYWDITQAKASSFTEYTYSSPTERIEYTITSNSVKFFNTAMDTLIQGFRTYVFALGTIYTEDPITGVPFGFGDVHDIEKFYFGLNGLSVLNQNFANLTTIYNNIKNEYNQGNAFINMNRQLFEEEKIRQSSVSNSQGIYTIDYAELKNDRLSNIIEKEQSIADFDVGGETLSDYNDFLDEFNQSIDSIKPTTDEELKIKSDLFAKFEVFKSKRYGISRIYVKQRYEVGGFGSPAWNSYGQIINVIGWFGD